MSRYMAHQYEDLPFWWVEDQRATRLTPRPVTTPCFESEAHIIAFALNAVTEGYTLAALSSRGPMAETYDGPTEGVTP